MSEKPPNQRPATRPLDQPGSGRLPNDLQGVSPAVVDALRAGPRKGTDPLSTEGRGLFSPVPTGGPTEFNLPREPETLGGFRAQPDSVEVKARHKKIQALARAAREAAEAAPPEPAPRGTKALDNGTAPLDEMRQQLLNRRKSGTGPVRGTGPMNKGTNAKLEHLALRAKAKGDGKTDRLGRTIEAAIGEKGAVRLRQSLKALEDKALPGKLASLADSVNKLLPEGSEHYAKLGAEVGKQILQNNVNPLMAISMSLREVGERMEQLERWSELSNRERVGNMAMLTSSVSEILGAVTPPPASYGIQVLGAGMLLMGMAAEHAEAVEDLAKVAGGEKAQKAIAAGVDGASGQIASRVKNAWDDLSDRLGAKRKPRLPASVQSLVDSQGWKAMKQHPTGKQFTEGAENVFYNLAKRREAMSAVWDHRMGKLKKKQQQPKRKPAPEKPDSE